MAIVVAMGRKTGHDGGRLRGVEGVGGVSSARSASKSRSAWMRRTMRRVRAATSSSLGGSSSQRRRPPSAARAKSFTIARSVAQPT
jgi:hypothetical protein